MYVDEPTYMSYVVPGILALFLGLYLFNTPNILSKINEYIKLEVKSKEKAYTLIALGLISILIRNNFNTGNIAFILFLFELLLYIGICYLFYIFPEHKFKLFILTLGLVFFTSLNNGMFHKLLLIGSFFLFYIFNEKASFIPKLLLILFGFSFAYVIQSIKKDFREIVWNSKNVANPSQLFIDLATKEFLEDENKEANYIYNDKIELENQSNLNNRLNQGWIISKTLDNIPQNRDFLEGETIKESFTAALLPRFLFPEKAGAEKALENFRDITGLDLAKNSSMGLSIIAEFYANYGRVGAWLALFLYGLSISLIMRFIVFNLGKSSPVILIWFILFFFQVVKAEIDFIKILNHIVKAVLFFFLIKVLFENLNLKLFQLKD